MSGSEPAPTAASTGRGAWASSPAAATAPGSTPIRAVLPQKATQGYGFEVWGIHEATHGLLQRPVLATQLTPDSVKGILHLGGTILRTTNRDNPFSYPSEKGRIDCSAEVAEGYRPWA